MRVCVRRSPSQIHERSNCEKNSNGAVDGYRVARVNKNCLHFQHMPKCDFVVEHHSGYKYNTELTVGANFEDAED